MHIHKQELQNNPILICIVCFLVGPQDPASLCKPWDRLWTWMLGQHGGYFTTSLYIYIYIRHSQANLQLGLSDRQQITYTYLNNTLISTTNHQESQHSWVYQAINNNTCTYINNKWPFLGLGPTMDPQAYNSPTSPSSTSLCRLGRKIYHYHF